MENKKKILFILPSRYDEKGNLVKSKMGYFPSRTLPYLAALTPHKYAVSIIDEMVDEVKLDTDADMIAFTGLLPNMPRALDLAKEFKRRNKTVIIGGVGAYSIKKQLAEKGVFDSIIIGEVDREWENILDDYDNGVLKKQYEFNEHPDLDRLPYARYDLLNMNKYIKSPVDKINPMISIETSRGCPHNCSYCLVTKYFGKLMRYRPIEDIVDEIKFQRAKHIIFTDDNIAINPRRARELFEALKPLKIHWFGQFDTGVTKHPGLLNLAAESGCRAAFVGIESLDTENLCSVNKIHNTKMNIRDIAKAFRDAGIIFLASLIFGLDNDTHEVIKGTIDQMLHEHVDTIFPWVLTPIPGTPVYDTLKKNNRLLHENYSLYDGVNIVINPNRMSVEELKKDYWKGLKRFYSLGAIIPRVMHAKQGRICELIYNLYVHNQVRKGLHPWIGKT